MSASGDHLLEQMESNKREDSWVIWETDSSGDLTGAMPFPLAQARESIHSRAIIVALNPGGSPEDAENREDWGNFHSPNGKHNDRFLAHAFNGTPFWGSYIVDLHPDIIESDSGKVKVTPEALTKAVETLAAKIERLGSVSTVICLGGGATDAVRKNAALLEKKTGIKANSIHSIWHYSGGNRMHKNNPETYRAHVHERLGLS